MGNLISQQLFLSFVKLWNPDYTLTEIPLLISMGKSHGLVLPSFPPMTSYLVTSKSQEKPHASCHGQSFTPEISPFLPFLLCKIPYNPAVRLEDQVVG